jgi:integrase
LRDYLIPYILETKSKNFELDRLFKDEFTRNDIIKSTVYYINTNENVESISAIDDFLIALNQLFDLVLFTKYPNANLVALTPFTGLWEEVNTELEEMGIKLNPRESDPAINDNQFEHIISYLGRKKSTSLKSFQEKILIKLFLLYGFSHDVVSNLEITDFDTVKRTLKINYLRGENKRYIVLELPFSLSNEIEQYLKYRKNESNINSNLLFVTGEGNQIKHGYISDILGKMRGTYGNEEPNLTQKNYFTPTGLQKYAVIKMILSGMNQSIITDLTGQKDDIFGYCQNEVNIIKELDRTRYINHMVRGIKVFDMV